MLSDFDDEEENNLPHLFCPPLVEEPVAPRCPPLSRPPTAAGATFVTVTVVAASKDEEKKDNTPFSSSSFPES